MTTYERVAGAAEAIVDGEVILLSPMDLSYHSLDRVGARVWEILATPTTDDDLIAVLTSEFDVSDEVCRADVTVFLERMIDIGVLRVS